NNLTRASLTELRAAETIVDLVPGADMVKFGKNGSTVTSAAVKLARSFTGRKLVVRCAEHPFFSYDDWFIGDTPVQRGIPEDISALTTRFRYNDIKSLETLFREVPGQVACVIMQPAEYNPPHPGFLQQVKEMCERNGTLLILDEMITGFRWHLQGAQTYYGIIPDLSTFGKGMANGFSVAALVGRREIMDLGSIKNEGAERVFLVSSTHGAEMCGLGAFVKTVAVYRELDVVGHLWEYGKKLIDGMNTIAREEGIQDYFKLVGYPCSPNYLTFGKDQKPSLSFRTLFAQEMIRHKILIPWIALSYAHGEEELEITLQACRRSLSLYRKALDDGIGNYLESKPIKPVFRKYN
ncbi:MAG: glutamate-1-semialdehyde 2,1-aminomutase, partial [Bacteroidales bacterium]|nr:glutamate-1-semialdehyde 2,1-aminomutase [Bacteroidales bacterium]